MTRNLHDTGFVVNRNITCGAVARTSQLVQNAGMSEPMNRQPHYLRQWRKHRNLTLARVEELSGVTASQISRMEREQSDYSRNSLEALAKVYDCKIGDLLSIDPSAPGAAEILEIEALLNELDPDLRRIAVQSLRAFQSNEAKKNG